MASALASKPIGSASHVDHAPLAPLLSRYPRQAGPLFHAYVDLVHSARWEDMAVVDLDVSPSRQLEASNEGRGSGMGAFIGRRPLAKNLEIIVPCHVTDMLSVAYFEDIFRALDSSSYSVLSKPASGTTTEALDTTHILLAIVSPDSTTVYYKLAKGLVKPVN